MRLARLGTVLLLLISACADDTEGVDDGGPMTDAMGTDAGPPPSPEGFRMGDTCFDGADNDQDLQLDCADDGCGTDSVCCVGQAACCDAGAYIDLDIPAGCTDGPVLDCTELASNLEPFGMPLPDFESGVLVPQGGTAWGGIAIGGPADPRAGNLVVEATVEVPSSRCTECIDAAGVGFLDAIPTAGERASVQLGVLVNGGRGELQVLVGDVPVETSSLTEGTHMVGVTLLIDGTASVTLDGASLADLTDIPLPETLQPAVFGRTQNRSDGEEAVGITSASARFDACDVPSAVDRRSTPVLPASTVMWNANDLGRPSALTFGAAGAERTRVAFAHDGEILLAGPNSVGELVGTSGPPDTILSALDGFEKLHDPWLLTEGTNVVIYLAGERADGTRTLLRTSGAPGYGLEFPEPTTLSLPNDYTSIDGPTVFRDSDDRLRMVARVLRDGETLLVAFIGVAGTPGDSFTYLHGNLDASIIHRTTPDDIFAIDRDEVAAPAIVRVEDTWRLYYSARRGARWSIGLLLSHSGDAWRPFGEVIGGDDSGFDALGARHAGPFESSGAVSFYYVGSDGSNLVLGLAGPPGTLGE